MRSQFASLRGPGLELVHGRPGTLEPEIAEAVEALAAPCF